MTTAPPPSEPAETTSRALHAAGVPAASVISEFLRAQAVAAPRSTLSRAFGKSPLSAEARPWYLGALGELAVAGRLARLNPQWAVLHSLPVGTRGSDIDHLAIGPGGVFTINTKFHEGARVWLASRRLLVNGQKTDHLRNARFEANRVAKLLTSAAGTPVPTSAVVALVGVKQLTVKSRPDDVSVLRDTELVRWLDRQPAILSPDALALLINVANDPSTWGDTAPAPDLAAFAAIRRTVESARRVRLAWGSGLLVAVPLSLYSASQLLQSLS